MEDAAFTLQPVTIEICCGVLDVSNLQQLQLLESMIKFVKPCYIHLGLPCGTCSRAREKPMPKSMGGHMGPQPLRNADNLLGLPHLCVADLTKVTLANQLYRAAIVILQLCFVLGCLVSIENPGRSWLWPLLALLVHETQDQPFIQWFSKLEAVYFDACAHGSSRDKRTKLLATSDLFSTLAIDCSGDHKHASWQPFRGEHGVVFPTAMEAEYPPLLCNRMAECVRQSAAHMGVFPSLQPRLKELLNLNLGHQTLRHEPLIPEYATVFQTDAPVQHESHKLLSAPFSQGHHSTEQPEGTQEHKSKRPRKEFKYGVWHTPEQFLTRAEDVVHPMDNESFLHEATKNAIKKVVRTDPLVLAKERLATVFNLRKLTNELKCQELALKDTMHPDVKRCTASKNILLFEHVLKQLGFWDMEVVSLLKQGIPLVGLQAAPNGYREQLVPASITEDELLQSAAWRRKSLMCQSKRFKPEEEAALLETTAEEVAKGFLEGPYSEQEISVLLETEDWSLSPRFVLFQGTGGKIRVIDDAKKSSVNAAYSSTVKLQLQDVDYAANMVLFLMSESAAAGISGDEWMGKTFDLSKAYKQLAILPAHQRHAVVGFPVSGTWRFYRSISLPFGCTGSVYGFVRVSQAIWYIVTRLLSAVSSHYFDDFSTLERAPGCRVLSLAFSAVLDMLGWGHAKEGDKALNFAGAFDLLGVNFNLALTPKGILQVTNKTTRIEKLCALLDKVKSEGEITAAQASELQGLLNFAIGFFSGKALKHLAAAFMPYADRVSLSKSGELQDLCAYAKSMLTSLGPRTHSTTGERRPILLFTDGAWEDGQASAGAILVDGDFRIGCTITVPDVLVAHWLKHAGEQIISQIELWALVAIRWHFRERLESRRLISWIDNEAARVCAIKASSPSPTMRALTRALSDMEVAWPVFAWTERVCSFSNPGDLPSRHKLSEAMRRFNVSDGGIVDATAELATTIVGLHERPFSAALLFHRGTTPEHQARNAN